MRWEIKRPKKAEPEINYGSSWLDRLKQLTQAQEATAAEIAALPDDTAYAWEKLSGEVHPPPWSSVNNCTRSSTTNVLIQGPHFKELPFFNDLTAKLLITRTNLASGEQVSNEFLKILHR